METVDGLLTMLQKILLSCGILAPLSVRLTPPQEAKQWNEMKNHLMGNDEALYRRFSLGDENVGTPRNTAYTIGYHIVQAYLEAHPTSTVLDLMNEEAQTILAESGYSPWRSNNDLRLFQSSQLGRIDRVHRVIRGVRVGFNRLKGPHGAPFKKVQRLLIGRENAELRTDLHRLVRYGEATVQAE